ncbi:MAG: hypothetical protein ACIAQF_09130 [Phycisphaerales bacterium JB065]
MKTRNAAVGAMVLAMCGVASADVVMFENDGTFSWIAGGSFPGNGLDITQDANQSGEITDNTFEWIHFSPPSSKSEGSASAYSSGGTNRIMSGSVAAGDMIGPSSDFTFGTGLFTYTFSDGVIDWLGYYATLGVKIEIEGQEHYGWIRLQWGGEFYYEPIAWAYETEPGVAIMATNIPAPATLAPLAAFGALTMRRRR